MPLPATLPRAPSLRRSRGFTLVELMAVVIIIAIFATLAAPTVTGRLRDTRARELAVRIAAVYRGARARAVGRGSAVLVRYTVGNIGQALFQTREALIGSNNGDEPCAALPAPSCTQTDWSDGNSFGNGTATWLDLGTLDARLDNPGPGVAVTFQTWTTDAAGNTTAGTAATTVDICFAPGGGVFQRPGGATGAWTRLFGVPSIGVQRLENGTVIGLQRSVLIPQTGAARLAF